MRDMPIEESALKEMEERLEARIRYQEHLHRNIDPETGNFFHLKMDNFMIVTALICSIIAIVISITVLNKKKLYEV